MAVVYYWDCNNFKGIKYNHNSEVPDNKVFEIAKEFFELGFHVMLIKGNPTVIYIDDKKFAQR